MESAGQYLSQPQQMRWGFGGLSGNFFISAEHECQDRRIVGPIQQGIACHAVSVEHNDFDELIVIHSCKKEKAQRLSRAKPIK
jgi:hypothetical protein